MDLFDSQNKKEIPLAARMRPRNLDEFTGQEGIVGPGRLLYRAIKADQLSSLIFYGPPGTGKTTLAAVIANTTQSHFITINAVLAGVKNIREAIDEANKQKKYYDKRTILFVDEVHRWNKAQQDALLPWVENGTIILIGATTENPYFEVNKALVSRSRIFQLKPLTEEDLYTIAHNVLSDKERGYGNYNVSVDKQALDHLVAVSNGDARSLLNALELAVETTPEKFPPKAGEEIHISLEVAEDSIQRKVVLYDKEGDYHFDTISAFIKSLRGSDPDATMYWLSKMVYAGEDPRFIFRRMLIFASEDIGMADPQALVVCEAAAAAFDRVGLPEGRFHLAHAALYLSTAQKSNSILGFFDALGTVEKEREADVPSHLRDSSRDKKAFGHGRGYLYPHAYTEHWVAQQYLPDSLQGKIFYSPGTIGYEKQLKKRLEKQREAQLALMFEPKKHIREILSFSPESHTKNLWLARAEGIYSRYLLQIKELLFERLDIQRSDLILDVSENPGLFISDLLKRVPEGGYYVLHTGINPSAKDLMNNLPEIERPVFLKTDITHLPEKLEEHKGILFNLIVGRGFFKTVENAEAALKTLNSLLRENGVIALVEPAPQLGQGISELLDHNRDKEIIEELKKAEDIFFYKDKQIDFDQKNIRATLDLCGFQNTRVEKRDINLKRKINMQEIRSWFFKGENPGKNPFSETVNREMDEEMITKLYDRALKELMDKTIDWRISSFLVHAQKQGRPS
jgi:putative ATPase